MEKKVAQHNTHHRQRDEKRLLLIFPWNFIRGDTGEHSRMVSLVKIMRDLGFVVDHLSVDTNWDGFQELNSKLKLIDELHIYNAGTGYKNASIPALVYQNIRRQHSGESLPDWTSPGMRCMLEEMLEHHSYSAICVFYAYYLPLVENLPTRSKIIYFMEDSCAYQAHYSGSAASLESLLEEECSRLELVDEVFCISNDEKLMYEKLTGRKFRFLPHLMKEEIHTLTTAVEKRKWDAFFVGFNNPYNVEAMHWYLEKVVPLLPPDFRTVIVGKVSNELSSIPSNVDIIPFADDLEEIYANGKVCICPMFHGTGMKIKVVEAMAYGIPVVCSTKGVDGLPDKMHSGCLVSNDPAQFARNLLKLVKDESFYAQSKQKIEAYYKKVFSREKYVKLMDEALSDRAIIEGEPMDHQRERLRFGSHGLEANIALLTQSPVLFYRDLSSNHKGIAKIVIFIKRVIRKLVRFLLEPIVDDINRNQYLTTETLAILHQILLQQNTSVPEALLKGIDALKVENRQLLEEIRSLKEESSVEKPEGKKE